MEDDPMQEFLAREQAILGADAALFGNPMETSENHQVSPSFNAEIDQLVPSEKLVADNIVDTDLNALHDAGLGSIGDPIVMDFPTETLVAGEPSGVFGGFKEQQNLFQQPVAEQVEEKSQALIAWQLEFEQKIAERDLKAKEKHDRMLVEAKEQLEKFYADYGEKKAKSIQKSKDLEVQTIAALSNSSGNVWESVLKQIEVNPKAKLEQKEKVKEKEKKEGKKVASETARFKQVLMSLKADPKAPGLTAAK